MKIKKISKKELLLAAIYASEHMRNVDGSIDVTIFPEDVEGVHLYGNKGLFIASIGKQFLQNNIEKKAESFGPGIDRYDYYQKYSGTLDEERENRNITWQIEINKVGGFFSTKFIGVSFIGMYDLLFPIGLLETDSLQTLFLFLCTEANTPSSNSIFQKT